MSQTRIQTVSCEQMPQVRRVIASANPRLGARSARFRAAGTGWTGASAMACEADGMVAAVGHTPGDSAVEDAVRQAGAAHRTHTPNNRRTFPESPGGGRGFNRNDLAVALKLLAGLVVFGRGGKWKSISV